MDRRSGGFPGAFMLRLSACVWVVGAHIRADGGLAAGGATLPGSTFAVQFNLTTECAKDYRDLRLDWESSWPGQPASASDCAALASSSSNSTIISQKNCVITYILSSNDVYVPAQMEICVPNSCNNNDTLHVFKAVLARRNLNISRPIVDCSSGRTFDRKALIALTALGLLIALVLLGTAFDVGRIVCRYAAAARHRANDDVFSAVYSVPTSPMDESMPLLGRSISSRSSQPLPPPPSLDDKQGTATKLMLAFSAYSNGSELLSTRLPTDAWLRCLHGLRVINLSWIGLSYSRAYLKLYNGSRQTLDSTDLSTFSVLALLDAALGIDTLFLLSGLLAMFLILKELDEHSGKLGIGGWIMLYFHRLLRITPAYGFVLLLWSCLAAHVCEAPLWPASAAAMSLDPACLNNWWTNLIYINNVYPTNATQCLPWSWPVAADMQFFIITPILAYCTHRCLALGVIIGAVLTIISSMTAAAITVMNNVGIEFVPLRTPQQSHIDYQSPVDNFSSKPWCRFQSYGVGLILAIYIYRGKHRSGLSTPLVIASWTAAVAVYLALLYGPYHGEHELLVVSVAEAALYNSVGRIAWCMAVGWVVLACCSGSGGWANTLLSWRAFVPLSRVTYTSVIVYPMLVALGALASGSMLHVSAVSEAFFFVASLVLAYVASFLLTLLVEAPVMAIEKTLVKRP